MSFQWEERHLGQTEHGPALGPRYGLGAASDSARAHSRLAEQRRLLLSRCLLLATLWKSIVRTVEERAMTQVASTHRRPEDCSACHGTGKETILRNYLAEAFRIAANPQANLQLERAHLVALTAYARQTVNALMSVQEVA